MVLREDNLGEDVPEKIPLKTGFSTRGRLGGAYAWEGIPREGIYHPIVQSQNCKV